MDISTIIGSAGVGLLLIAFFLNLFNWMHQDSLAYILLNIIGGGMSCYASILIGFWPFVILEGTWCVVSVVAIIAWLKKKKESRIILFH